MVIVRKRKVNLFVDHTSGRWVIQDRDGLFWIIPVMEDAWEHKELFTPTNETDLEPVPDHYKYMLGLPE